MSHERNPLHITLEKLSQNLVPDKIREQDSIMGLTGKSKVTK